ncbi:malonyl-ACP O-methyltransferase BioC [Psychromonas sp. CD1]|uniref:malonyl-ACP O-methyltransferase BioC n=1 Tax=Psychromonas sp. CD1 TaxID=1979839 RepID=UPI000B9C01BE|nr:malonyl-ACP O-methyltransferase BioC [Psychromonas sp. CD1]
MMINKQAVEASFSKAAAQYDDFAQLQCSIGDKLFSDITLTAAPYILDMGCGTGFFSAKLRKKFTKSNISCFDLSAKMLHETKKRVLPKVIYIQGDIDALPFCKATFDLIYSNLVVQWSADLQGCLKQIQVCLKKGGTAYISTLLDGSLDELKQAWKHVDNYPHTNNFIGLDLLRKQLKLADLTIVKIRVETRILTYSNVLQVMRSLKGIGANHVHASRGCTLGAKSLIKTLQRGYQPFTNTHGELPLTYQVCYMELTKK